PVVTLRETPHGGTENEVLAPGGIGEETASFEGEREAEHAAAVDANEVGELGERNGIARVGDRLEDDESAVEALDRLRLARSAIRHSSLSQCAFYYDARTGAACMIYNLHCTSLPTNRRPFDTRLLEFRTAGQDRHCDRTVAGNRPGDRA